MIQHAEPRFWNVVFMGEKSRKLGWWDRWTQPGFRHVLAWADLPAMKAHLVFDPGIERGRIVVLDDEAFDAWLVDTAPHMAAVVRIPRHQRKPFWLGLRTCIQHVSHILGRPTRAVTPLGFYRDLLRQGAIKVFPNEQRPQRRSPNPRPA